MVIFDARGNEFVGALDRIIGTTVTDARAQTVSLAALNAEGIIDCDGAAVVVFNLQSAAMNMTLVFEGTVDGTNYFALPAINIQTGAYIASFVSATTAANQIAVTATGWKRVRCRVSAFTSGAVTVAGRATLADYVIGTLPKPSDLGVTVTGAANGAATLTLPAAAGLFHYITSLYISRQATAALAGTAVLTVTNTNLPAALAWVVGNAMVAGGTQIDVQLSFSSPIKSSVVNTASTIVMPAPGAAVQWKANATYYLAP